MNKPVIVKLSEPTSQYQQKILLDNGFKWKEYSNQKPIYNVRFLYIDIDTKEMTWSYGKVYNDSITFEEFDNQYMHVKTTNVTSLDSKLSPAYKALSDRILKNNISKDKINPSHYKQYSRETIDTMQGASTPEEFKGYLKLNIIKYISRYQSKNGVEDLKKAQWYLNKLTEVVDDENRSKETITE